MIPPNVPGGNPFAHGDGSLAGVLIFLAFAWMLVSALTAWGMGQIARRAGKYDLNPWPIAVPLGPVLLRAGWQLLPESLFGMRPLDAAGTGTFVLIMLGATLFFGALVCSVLSAPFRKSASDEEQGLGGLVLTGIVAAAISAKTGWGFWPTLGALVGGILAFALVAVGVAFAVDPKLLKK